MTEDLYHRLVLDHGSVRLLNAAGPIRRFNNIMTDEEGSVCHTQRDFDADDVDPARTARLSLNGKFNDKGRSRESDLKLNRYLMKNSHTTPIEMIETWWEVELPIFVARQFVRHRTVTINEVSARYSVLPNRWYIPAKEVVGFKSPTIKQGRSDIPWDEMTDVQRQLIEDYRTSLESVCRISYDQYQISLDNGIAPELARLFLHVNHYTRWIWKQDLHNLMHMMSLRQHSHAQTEARAYADAYYDIIKQVLPDLIRLYDDYRKRSD